MTIAAAETPLAQQLETLARNVFTGIVQDLGDRLSTSVTCLESGVVDSGWPRLKEHFRPLGTRVDGVGPSLGDEKFSIYLDQRASYLLPGTLLEFPDPVLADLVRGGVFNEDLQRALSQVGDCIVGTLKRCVQPLGIGADLLRGETAWKPALLDEVDLECQHLHGLLGFRQTRLFMLVSLPPLLTARLDGE